MEPALSPLSTARLKPFRQRINRTIMTITDSGYVSMEIMCRHGNQPETQEVARELFHVSPDGKNVEVYQNADGVAAIDGCPIPGQPYKAYHYPDLPVKQMKKYQHASKFVELVKSRTAKVVLVTERALCKLMENSEPADFKAEFTDGSAVLISKTTVTVTDHAGGHLSCDVASLTQLVNPETLALVEYANQCHLQCLKIERSMGNLHSVDEGHELFPITVGSAQSPFQIRADLSLHSARPDPPAPHCASVEIPTLAQALVHHSGTDVWLQNDPYSFTSASGDARANVSGVLPSYQNNFTGTSCSDPALQDLIAGQLTDYEGSSRGSSVKSISRSATPKKGNSNLQTLGQLDCSDIKFSVQPFTYVPYVPSSMQPEQASFNEECNSFSVQNNLSTISNEHLKNTSFQHNHPSTVPSYCPNNHQSEFHTPKRHAHHHYHQEQMLERFHTPSADLLAQRRHHHHQLLLEHRMNVASGMAPESASVSRALFTDLAVAPLPTQSPVPSTRPDTLHKDMMAIQRSPALELSNCSDEPEESVTRPALTTSTTTIPSQIGSQSWIEEFNMSVSLSASDMSKEESREAAAPSGDFLSQSLPVSECELQQKSMSQQASSPRTIAEAVATMLPQHKDFKMNKSIQSPIHKHVFPAVPGHLKSTLNHPHLAFNTNSLKNPHLAFNSSSNTAYSSNSSSGNNSTNSGAGVDMPYHHKCHLPTQLRRSLDNSSLPAQVRCSLDMSTSSHFSDCSAPSSSGGPGDVLRQLFVPYTGWASLHASGAVWILYNDGTQLGLTSAEAAMVYVDQDGSQTKYKNTDIVPEIVKMKLEKMPTIVDQLMKSPPLTPALAFRGCPPSWTS